MICGVELPKSLKYINNQDRATEEQIVKAKALLFKLNSKSDLEDTIQEWLNISLTEISQMAMSSLIRILRIKWEIRKS